MFRLTFALYSLMGSKEKLLVVIYMSTVFHLRRSLRKTSHNIRATNQGKRVFISVCVCFFSS